MIAKRAAARQPTRRTLRGFGLLTGAFVLILFCLLLPLLHGDGGARWPWVVAASLWAWALLHPASLAPVYRGWLVFGRVLSWINTRVLLAVVFYALFLPVGLVMRLLRHDPMARRIDRSQASYRVTRPRRSKDHLERPY